MRYEIDTTKILNQLLHYVWVMILAFAVGAASGYLYVNEIKADTYTSSLSMVVNGETDDPYGVNVAKGVIKTAVTVMRSDTFINDNIVDKVDWETNAAEIRGMTRFSIEEDSLIAYIRVTSDSPERAYEIANAFYNADYSYIAATVKGSAVNPVDKPELSSVANAKNSTYTGFMTGLITALLSAVVIVLITVFDTRINSEDDLANLRGEVPIIGVIPSFAQTAGSLGKYGGYSAHYGYDTRNDMNSESKEDNGRNE
jgi:capsular polysaccharide biosynthesis protein